MSSSRKLARTRKRAGLPVENAARTCGGCSACCTVLGVPELEKGQYEPCKHERGRCTIYAERPQRCRDFTCLWLQGIGNADQRPDKLGIVLSVTQQDSELSQQMVVAYECKEGGVKNAEPVILGLAKVSAVVIVQPGAKNRKVVGPRHLVEEVEALVKKRLPVLQ